MRITTQFKIILIVFSLILLAIGLSIAYTVQQVGITQRQENFANGIVVSANELSYLSSDYVIYHGTTQLAQWQASYNSFSNQVGNLSVATAPQKELVQAIQLTQQQVAAVFNGIVTSTEASQGQAASNQSSALETAWARMSIQTTSLTSDATQLARLLQDQVNQENLVDFALVIGMIAAFILLLATIYFQTFRRTLKSLSDMKSGTSVIGSGDLDFKLNENKKDEIGELAQAFNQMTANLKIVTASKTDLEKAQSMVQQERDRLSSALNGISDEVWFADSEKKFILANPSAVKNFKLDSSTQIVDVENLAATSEVYRSDGSPRPVEESPPLRALKGEIVKNEEEIVRTPGTGELRTRLVNSVPIKNETGNIIGSVSVVRDITERKKAEEAVARQAELIDLSPDAIIVRKLDGTITFWSKGAEKLYGLTKNEAIGQDINSLLKTEFPQPLEKILKTVKLDGKWSGEIVHTCKNGDKVIVQSFWLAKFGSDGKVFEMLESNMDITDRVELQAKLEESAVRVEEYANQMEDLAEKRAAQLKDAERLAAIGATAGMVGHDIRNPLQAITSDVFLAKTDLIAVPESEEKKSIQESLSEIEKNVDYINKIVADLQDFARPLNLVQKKPI